MSRLDQLIEELCPNGVEYKCLGDIGQVKMCKRILKSQTNTNGEIPFYKIGTFGGEANAFISEELFQEYKEKYPYPKVGEILISAAGTIGRTVVYDGEPAYYQDSNIVWLSHDESHILNTFLRYCYELKPWNVSSGGTIARLYNDNILKAKVPVPPLEVQREIVNILDSFTLLTAELTAELTVRKKQYEFYRDKLLTFDTAIKHVRLGDICSVITKGTTPKSYTKTGVSFVKTEAFDGTKIIPDKLSYVDEETHTTFLRRSMLEENDILITIAGATIGKCAIVPKEILPANTNQALAIIRLAKGNCPKYIMYLLQSDLMKQYIQKNIKGSAQPNLNLKQLNDFIIPLPPLNVQERLVRVLDNFEAICTDLNIGLPAEIEARQKQYEYYRDLLLTFAETGSMLMTDRQTDRQTDR